MNTEYMWVNILILIVCFSFLSTLPFDSAHAALF